MCKSTGKDYAKDDVEIKEEQIKAAKEKAMECLRPLKPVSGKIPTLTSELLLLHVGSIF